MPQQSLRQIDVEFSQRAIVEGFIGYVQHRATDARHTRNASVIADFIDKFAIVELKRLRIHDEIIPGVINVPASLFGPAVPAMATAVAPVDTSVPWGTTPAPVRPARPAPAARPVAPAPVQAPAPAPAPAQAPASDTTVSHTAVRRNSNGHESEKVRNLTADEKNKLRQRFIRLNGQIPEDKTVEWTAEFNEGLAADQSLSAFQVPGYIAYLHGQVTRGVLIPRDMAAYKLYLDAHHARYPGKYPELARRARTRSPEAASQDEAARALWHKASSTVQEVA